MSSDYEIRKAADAATALFAALTKLATGEKRIVKTDGHTGKTSTYQVK